MRAQAIDPAMAQRYVAHTIAGDPAVDDSGLIVAAVDAAFRTRY